MIPRRVQADRRAAIAIVLLLASPLVVLPGGLERFALPKAAVAAAGVAVACRVGGSCRLPRSATGLLAAAVGVLLVAAATATSPFPQLVGRAPRYEGIFVIAVYLGAIVAGCRLLAPADRRVTAVVAATLSITAVTVAFFAVLETIGVHVLSTSVSRPGSLLGNASDEGAWALLVLMPLTAIGVSGRDRLALVGAAAAAVTVALSGSRGALVGLAVACIVLVVLRGTRLTVAAVAALIAGVAVLALAVPSSRDRIVGASPLSDATVTGRGQLWGETVGLDAAHLLTGVGPSGFIDAITARHDLRWFRAVGPANPPDSPHDWLLQSLTAGGVPLLAVALLFVAVVAGHGWRRARAPSASPLVVGAAAGLAGYAVALLAHFTTSGTTPTAAMWIGTLLGTTAATGSAGTRDRWLAALAVVVAAVLTVASFAEWPMRAAISAVDRGDVTVAVRDFNVARDLRPWDIDTYTVAAHALAAAALNGDSAAVAPALLWTQAPVHWLPHSEQALVDRAMAEEAAGELAAAADDLAAAQRLDPYNPDLLLRRGVVAAEAHQTTLATRLFHAASYVVPASPQPWEDLAALYRSVGDSADARAAQATADRLTAARTSR